MLGDLHARVCANAFNENVSAFSHVSLEACRGAEAVVNGWLNTADIGQFDAAGWLTPIDRKKDIIIRGCENLYPAEIEEVLVSLDAVREAAVVGRADPVMGEVPIAFVALRARARRESLISELAEHLASCKIPVAFHVLEALPRNPIGKIDKPSLRAMNTAQLEEIL